MTTQNTQVTVDFKDQNDPEENKYSCDLSFETDDADNSTTNPEVGANYNLRLFIGSDLKDIIVFSTNGSSFLGSEGTAEVGGEDDDPIYITLDGGRTASLPYPAVGEVTVEEWGTIYRKDGTVASGTTYTPSGESEISVSENLYGVLKVSYTTKFNIVTVTPSNEGTMMVVATATCSSGETISTNITLTVKAPGEGDDEDEDEYYCDLNFELNDEDNFTGDESARYEIGGTYFARLYKGQDVESVTALNTNGTISQSGTGTGQIGDLDSTDNDDKIFVSFTGSKTASVSYPIRGGFEYEVVGTFYDIEGNEIGSPSFQGIENEVLINGDKKVFGSLRIAYNTSYDKYTFNINEEGETVIAAITSCHGNDNTSSFSFEALSPKESSSCCCSSCDSSSDSAKTDVTITFKDYITGAVLSGVQVYIDNMAKGSTNESGSITVVGLDVGRSYKVKGTKEGYLNTDSDSLANDEFIIVAS